MTFWKTQHTTEDKIKDIIATGTNTPKNSSIILRWVRVALMSLFALLFGLLFAEVILAIGLPQLHVRPKVWQFDRQLGWAHIPNAHGRLVTPEFDVEYRINNFGLRDPDSLSARSGKCILFFGDSFAEGWGVPIDQAVSERLQENISQKQIANQVHNFGVAGYGTDQQLLMFQRISERFSPDIVIVLFYGNDLWNNSLSRGIGVERGYKPRFVLGPRNSLHLTGVPVRRTRYWDTDSDNLPMKWRMSRYFRENWHLAVLLHKAFAEEVPTNQQNDFYLALYGLGESADRFEELWTITDRLLLEFDQRVRASGARLALVYAPAIVQVEAEDWKAKKKLHGLIESYDIHKPNERLREIAEKYEIPFLDLGPSFNLAAVSSTLFYRDSHWNQSGHALAARDILDFLIERNWFE